MDLPILWKEHLLKFKIAKRRIFTVPTLLLLIQISQLIFSKTVSHQCYLVKKATWIQN